MTTDRRDLGTEILEGLQQLKRGETGRVTTYSSVSVIRAQMGLSHPQFARLVRVSVRTLQEWEQGRRSPSGPAKTLLEIAHRNPKVFLELARE